MATDFRTLTWTGQPIATAQSSPPTGFTQGHAYAVKAAAIDNVTGFIWVLLVNDALTLQAVQVTGGGSQPFTFQ